MSLEKPRMSHSPSPKPAPLPVAAPAPAGPKHGPVTVHRDLRTYLPPILSRFLGYKQQPLRPLPFPPFSWLSKIPLKYEVWGLGLLASFVGIMLVELVMATAFADQDIILIVASFGASAVLIYGTIESPLAQPRHLLGGHVIAAILGVAITRLFRKATNYELHDTTHTGELRHVVWLNGALSMSVALTAMQITGTVHPPAGATALIASVQPAAVHMSWHFIYIVLISALLMLAWAMIINNVGRRRYPTYWLSGSTVFVKPPQKLDPEAGVTPSTGPTPNGVANGVANGGPSEVSTAGSTVDGGVGGVQGAQGLHGGQRLQKTTTDEVMMAAIEGRNDGMARMVRSLSREGAATSQDEAEMAAIEGRNDGMQRLVRSLSREAP